MTQVMQYLSLPWTWDIRFDAEEGCWVAVIAELPDFFAAGANPGEAVFNAREALQSHLSGYIASGTPIPTPNPRSPGSATSGPADGSAAQLVAA